MSAFPDYGSPGAPNLDPYYRSPAQVADDEAMHQAAMADLLGGLDDLIAEARKGGVLTTPEIADILRDAASSMVLS